MERLKGEARGSGLFADLKLVKDRAGVENFVITGEAVTDMEKYINDLVKKYYQEEYKYHPAEITEN